MFPLRLFHVCYEADGAGGGPADQSSDGEQSTGATPETIENWLESQSEDLRKVVKPLLDARLSALQNTVKATRRERDDFAKQLRAVSKTAEAGSEQQKELERLSTTLEEVNRRAEFYEQAPSYECRNPKVAYAVAVASELFTKSGAPDWKAIQAEAPELFGKPSTAPRKSTAGSGTGDSPPKAGTMNDWIRAQAGVHTTTD